MATASKKTIGSSPCPTSKPGGATSWVGSKFAGKAGRIESAAVVVTGVVADLIADVEEGFVGGLVEGFVEGSGGVRAGFSPGWFERGKWGA